MNSVAITGHELANYSYRSMLGVNALTAYRLLVKGQSLMLHNPP